MCICEDCQHFVVFVLELSCDVEKMSSNKPKQQKHKRRLYGGQKRHLLNLGKYAASLMVVVVSSPGWPMWKLVSMIPFYIGCEKDLSKGVEQEFVDIMAMPWVQLFSSQCYDDEVR